MNVKINEKPTASVFPLEENTLYKYTFPAGNYIIGLVRKDKKNSLRFVPIFATEEEPHNFIIWEHDFNRPFPSDEVLSKYSAIDFGIFSKFDGKIELSND